MIRARFRPIMLAVLTGCCVLTIAPWGAMADDETAVMRFVPLSSTSNVTNEDFSISSTVYPHIAPGTSWSVRGEVLHGGKQEGTYLITIECGELKMRVVPTRGMSILDVSQGDLRLGWNSPVKELVHPQYIDLDTRGGLGWLDGFNEWMVRCGLEFAGHPGRDSFIDNTGATAEMDLTLHGKVGNIPASEVELIIEKAPPYRFRLRGTVYERMFFGPKLRLDTEIVIEPGTQHFDLVDTVTNEGAQPQEIQLIYHTNFGTPLLEEGATIRTAAKRVRPMNEYASDGIEAYQTYGPPTAGFIEKVYLFEMLGDEQGQAHAMLVNADESRGCSLSWNLDQLPYFTLWKNTVAEADGYVTGLEPATCYPFNRKVERAHGRVPQLAPGETRTFAIRTTLHSSKASVAAMTTTIEQIQKQQQVVIDPSAPDISHD